MEYLDNAQVQNIFQDCFQKKSDDIKQMNLEVQTIANYTSPTGQKSVRAKLATKDGTIEIYFSFLIKERKSYSFLKNQKLDDSFFINEYLQYKGEDGVIKKLKQLKSETLEEYLKRYIFEVIALLNSELNDVITGRKWENVPVPESILGVYK